MAGLVFVHMSCPGGSEPSASTSSTRAFNTSWTKIFKTGLGGFEEADLYQTSPPRCAWVSLCLFNCGYQPQVLPSIDGEMQKVGDESVFLDDHLNDAAGKDISNLGTTTS